MILRKTLPIINANLSKLLNGVCDFDVEIKITEKNEVMIYLIKDGIYSELESGSGFELTCGALALRSVLSKISTMPRANFFMADEIFGSVAKSNMENMHQLFSRISEDYDFILNVTHDETLKDWFDTVITIEKKDNISFISARK
jgi:DNA repair exonuclease SbcCD ATPase subunit